MKPVCMLVGQPPAMFKCRSDRRAAYKTSAEVFPDNCGEGEPWTPRQVRREVKPWRALGWHWLVSRLSWEGGQRMGYLKMRIWELLVNCNGKAWTSRGRGRREDKVIGRGSRATLLFLLNSFWMFPATLSPIPPPLCPHSKSLFFFRDPIYYIPLISLFLRSPGISKSTLVANHVTSHPLPQHPLAR